MYDEKYSPLQVLLHWFSAALILWVSITGFGIAYAEVEPQLQASIAAINVALGTLFIPVFILRWACRLVYPKPRCIHEYGHLKQLACLVHECMYGVTALVLLSGVLMMNRPIAVFGWFSIPPLLRDAAWQDFWFGLHIASCLGLALLVTLHVGAVVMHEMLGRRLLRRMSL